MISMLIYRNESFITIQQEGLRSPLGWRFIWLSTQINALSSGAVNTKLKLHQCIKNRTVISGGIRITLEPLSKRGRILGINCERHTIKTYPLAVFINFLLISLFCRPAYMSSYDSIGPLAYCSLYDSFSGQKPHILKLNVMQIAGKNPHMLKSKKGFFPDNRLPIKNWTNTNLKCSILEAKRASFWYVVAFSLVNEYYTIMDQRSKF